MGRPRASTQPDSIQAAPAPFTEVELIPDATSLIESMRDFGYSLDTAVADIVDNSLTAGAKRIEILTFDDGTSFRLGILDDGRGMDREELLTAMAPGSRSPLEERSKTDLGRFGLGLKTASFSQCRRLTVVTRKMGITSVARWDLDHVQQQGKWAVQLPITDDGVPWADRLGLNGTLVLWENVDRLVSREGLRRPEDRASNLNERLAALTRHMELVFHRFIAGEPGHKKVSILLNGRPLEAFDPFNSNNSATQFLAPEEIHAGNNIVSVQPVVLPHFSKVDRPTWERYAGAAGYLRSQGFYLYRQRRLIIHGTWFGLMRQTAASQLARVRLDIDNRWDSEWKIDVKKASAQLPPIVRSRLREIIEQIDAQSRRPFAGKGRIMSDSDRLPVWLRTQEHGSITYRISEDHPLIAGFRAQLSVLHQAELSKVLAFASASLPIDTIFADLGSDAEKVTAGSLNVELLEEALAATVARFRAAQLADIEIHGLFGRVEPYKSNWALTEKILRKLLPNMEQS